jgi:hypothetical protein
VGVGTVAVGGVDDEAVEEGDGTRVGVGGDMAAVHGFVSFSATHGKPPYRGRAEIFNKRTWVPCPFGEEQALHSVQLAVQFTGAVKSKKY